MDNAKTIDIGLGYKPQSSDPTNPKEGDMFQADGTSRAKGLWEYRDGDWEQVGGQGGSLDLLLTEDFNTGTKASSFTTGQSAIFGDSGTIGGTLADEEASPISGKRSMKFTTGSVANDWFHLDPLTIEEKEQGKFISVSLHADYDGDADEMKLIAYDDTNSEELDSVGINSSDLKRYTLSFWVPTNCTSIKIGFQHTGTTASKILRFDDLQVSIDPLSTITLDQETVYTAFITNNGTAAVSSESAPFIQSVSRTAAGIVSITFKSNFFSQAPAAIADGAPTDFMASVQEGTVTASGCTVTTESSNLGTDTDADFFIIVQRQGADYSNQKQQAQVIKNASSQNDDLVMNTGNGRGSTATSTLRLTNTEESSVYTEVTDTAADGTEIKILEDGKYDLSLVYRNNANSDFGITLNAGGTNDPNGTGSDETATVITSVTNSRVLCEGFITTNAQDTINRSVLLKKNDILRVQDGASGAGTDARIKLSVAKIGTSQLTGVPFPLTAYVKDEKGTGVNGGTSSSNTVHTRDLNTLSGDTSFISLNSNQITLSPGTYDISGRATSYASGLTQSFFYNVTDTSYDIIGDSDYGHSASATVGEAKFEGRLELTESKTFELRHWIATGRATDGLGAATDTGTNNPVSTNVYSTVKITKIK